MTLKFDSQGVQIDTYAELFEKLVDGYEKIYGSGIDVDQESPDGQRIGIEAKARLDIEQALAWLYSQIDPERNSGDMQKIIAKLYGLYPQPAARSQWDLTVNVSRDVTLTDGYKIKDDDGQEWFLSGDESLSAGDNTVTFRSVQWGGVIGSAGSEFTQITPEIEVQSITAPTDAKVGRKEETEEEFRKRRNRSLENPARSTKGAIYAKLAALTGVTDVVVYENDTRTYDAGRDLESLTMWVVVEGGDVDDIAKIVVTQRLGSTKGSIIGIYPETLVRPNGQEFTITHEQRFDRPEYVPLYIRCTATRRNSSQPVDTQAIKNGFKTFEFLIGQTIQAADVYDSGLIGSPPNYILTGLELSTDGVNYTDGEVFAGYQGKFTLDDAYIDITEVTP